MVYVVITIAMVPLVIMIVLFNMPRFRADRFTKGGLETGKAFVEALGHADHARCQALVSGNLPALPANVRFSNWSLTDWEFVNDTAVATGTVETTRGELDIRVHLTRGEFGWRVVGFVLAGQPFTWS
jgi:hypothetical protein